MVASVFSPTQILGYIAFVLGVFSFLQKNDRRFRISLSFQAVVYGVHFLMLGNVPAAASNLVSLGRNVLSLKSQSNYIAAVLVVITVVLGYFTIKSPIGYLTIGATIISTIGMFNLQGIRMRLCMLFCTFLWLANGILSHSIGGVMLEAVIGITNTFTIVRLYLGGRDPKAAADIPEIEGAWPPPAQMPANPQVLEK
ncbi:MAG TPA: YgjV family protein [Capsulimonadaceae bacterium]|jgi:hypothetical protein